MIRHTKVTEMSREGLAVMPIEDLIWSFPYRQNTFDDSRVGLTGSSEFVGTCA